MIVAIYLERFLLENAFKTFLMLIAGVLKKIKGEEMIVPKYFV